MRALGEERKRQATIRRATTCFLLAASVLLAPAGARAHPFDTYGFTSRAIAMGGAATAAATDLDATYYNPAAVARTRGLVAGAGLLVADDFLTVDGDDAGLDTQVLLEIGVAASLPLGEVMRDRLFLSLVIALPHSGLYDVVQPDDAAVGFPFWDARNRRVVLSGVLAARITDWLLVGLGTTMLPDVTGAVQVDLAGSSGRNATQVAVDYNFAAVAGVLAQPLPWLAFGVTYRQAQATRIDLPVDVDVIADFPPVSARVVSPAYALPHELAFGVEVRPLETLTIAVDLTWYHYSQVRYSSPDVTVFDTGGEIVQESRAARSAFHDVFAPRLGVEWRALPWLLVRGGYAWIGSPVPAQTGVTNLLDADRNVLSLGLGFDLPGEWFGGAIRRMAIDVHGQLSLLRNRAVAKEEFLPDNPGFPRISLSGGTFSFGLSGRVWF